MAVLFCGCRSGDTQPFDLTKATFVGQASCVKCHQEQVNLHAGSHHDQAMQLATEETVRGDFADAQLEHHGVVSKFYRDGSRYMVQTEGPDGQLTDFEVKYVFGLEPLQQYMIEFPTGHSSDKNAIPRVQVLRLCWDTEEEEWFYLPPPDVPEKLDPTDDLHWTGIAQRWNNMCAECHSTDYQKNFSVPASHLNLVSTGQTGGTSDTQSDNGHYASTFMEINVSCEACHGPGSVHIDLAKQWFPGWNRERGYGLANLKVDAESQIQACAPCHSRRGVVAGGFRAGDNFYDHYTTTLLTEGVYYPDGQILDEDYVHGSFIQSKMYHKGIKCSDCHDPHTARLKHDGNEVCTSCHQHPGAKYDTVAHHFHKPEGEGAKCVNCHMPSTTYMAVDARRDHSFRIPRPDLSSKLGTPNACTGCHLEKGNVAEGKREQLKLYQDWMLAAREGDEEVQAEIDRANQWCDEACDRWYGENRRRDQHFGIAISAGQQRLPEAVSLLRELLSKRGYEAPAVARATAIQVLSEIDPIAAAEEAERGIEDDSPIVRAASTSALLANQNPPKAVGLLAKALKDPMRSVRSEAVRNLLEYPRELWNERAGAAFRQALTELVEGLNYNNDRAGAHLALGILAEQQGRDQQAIRNYEAAISVEPGVTGPRTNLAALLERNLNNRASDATRTSLEEKVTQLRKDELPLLKRDVDLLPEAAGIQYRYGLALYVDGQPEEAVKHLVKAAELEPEQTTYAQAAAMLFESLQRWEDAIRWCQVALEAAPGDPGVALLMQRIQAAANQASQP